MTRDRVNTLADHVSRLEREEHFSGVFRATQGDNVIIESCTDLQIGLTANPCARRPVSSQRR